MVSALTLESKSKKSTKNTVKLVATKKLFWVPYSFMLYVLAIGHWGMGVLQMLTLADIVSVDQEGRAGQANADTTDKNSFKG